MLLVGIGQRQWTGRLKTKNLGLGGFEPQTSWMDAKEPSEPIGPRPGNSGFKTEGATKISSLTT